MSFFNPGTTSTATATEPKDVEVADPPADSISSLAFSSAGEYLAVGSWDNNVRVYYCTFSVMPYLYLYLIGSYLRSKSTRWSNTRKSNVPTPSTCARSLLEQGKTIKENLEFPFFNSRTRQDGDKIISVGADNAARAYDLQSGQQSQVAQHDQPIKCVRWIDSQGGILVT